jgi:serine/threonine protein kinase
MVLNSSTLSACIGSASAPKEGADEAKQCQLLLNALKKKSCFPNIEFTDLITHIPTGEAVVFRGKWIDSSSHSGRVVDVAIKLYQSDDNMKFKQELTLMQRIGEHPNVLIVLAHFESPNNALVFPLVTGGGLDKVLEKRALPPNIVCQYGLQVAKGLQHMHSKKVAHLDLKSANVLISHTNAAIISDFGLSSSFNGEDHVEYKGTAPFMAPEVWAGDGKGDLSKVDVYAFGMLLYEMLTGAYPWVNLLKSDQEQWNQDIKYNVQGGKRPPLDNKWPKSLVNMMEECWISSPSRRPSMKEIVEKFGKM